MSTPLNPGPGRDGVHLHTCPLCEAMCGLRIEVQGGQVASIRGDGDDPFSRGHLCPKAPALKDLHEDPDRLRRPLRRNGDRWEEIDWDEALDDAAKRLHSVQRAHGRDAVGIYLGNPTVHNLGSMLFGPMLVRALRTKNRFSATSVDQLPHMFVAHQMWGHQLLLPIPDVDRTECFVVIGGNPLASNGSLMTAPGMKRRLRELRERGGRLIVIDPRRTETARVADQHFFIRPGSDALLLAALLHVVIVEKLGRDSPALDLCDGREKFAGCFAAYAPEQVAGATGIPAAEIRGLARTIARATKAAIHGRMGVSTQSFGSLCQWLINCLHLVTGNFDRPGGVLFTRPAFDVVGGPGALASKPGSLGRWRSRVRDLPEFGGELPAATLAEEILTPGEGQIRGMVTSAGNPVLSTPHGRQVERAFAGLDAYVAIDFYLNETTRHANLILPPTGPLEHDHYDVVFHVLAVRNTTRFDPAVFVRPADARHDYEIFFGLIERLEAHRRGGSASLGTRMRLSALKRLGPSRIVDLGLRQGPYGKGFNPLKRGLSLRQLRRHPHGIDLGPLQPSLPGRLRGGRRIDLVPVLLVDDLARLEGTLAVPPAPSDGGEESFLLIGRRTLRDNNSWMHNAPSLMSGRPRCTLLVHPDDASRLGLEDGARVRVASRVGEVVVPLECSADVMPGVVSLPHGYGHDRDGVRLAVAGRHAGASINDLTDDRAIDPVCGNAAFSGTPVWVTPADS